MPSATSASAAAAATEVKATGSAAADDEVSPELLVLGLDHVDEHVPLVWSARELLAGLEQASRRYERAEVGAACLVDQPVAVHAGSNARTVTAGSSRAGGLHSRVERWRFRRRGSLLGGERKRHPVLSLNSVAPRRRVRTLAYSEGEASTGTPKASTAGPMDALPLVSGRELRADDQPRRHRPRRLTAAPSRKRPKLRMRQPGV
jgi:hypothetical protein